MGIDLGCVVIGWRRRRFIGESAHQERSWSRHLAASRMEQPATLMYVRSLT